MNALLVAESSWRLRCGTIARSFLVASVAGAALLQGCGSKSINRAPVEDRGSPVPRSQPSAAVAQPLSAPASTTSAVVENVGASGYYTVKPGDTLIRIGLDAGQNWRDIVRWNAIDNPNVIEVGQVLRVVPPGAVPAGGAALRPVVSVTPVPIPVLPAPGGAAPSVQSASAAKPAAPVPSSGPSDDELAWTWPASGAVLSNFDEPKNKGIDIGGNSGEAVLAAADGRVMYVGAGLRGYGNLIILKHNNTYLTAYAHNQALLVKEDQAVRKGQKIAEMGSSDADRVKLHFEVRRQGKPVDPAKYLPPR